MKYEDLENIKAERINTVGFDLHQIKCRTFVGTPGTLSIKSRDHNCSSKNEHFESFDLKLNDGCVVSSKVKLLLCQALALLGDLATVTETKENAV